MAEPLPAWAFECELSKVKPQLECDLEGEMDAETAGGEAIGLCEWHLKAMAEEGLVREEE